MKRRSSTVLVALLATAGAAFFAQPARAAECSDADAIPLLTLFTIDRYEGALLCLMNEERIERGIRAVTPNAKLAQAASSHTSSMKANKFFSHNSLDGTGFEQRIEATGYLNGAGSWAVGENLGWGSALLGTPRTMVSSWMNSSAHRKTLLDGRFNEIGIGADWGSPIGSLPLSAIATTDFGYVDYGGGEAGSKKGSKKKRKKRRKKRRGR